MAAGVRDWRESEYLSTKGPPGAPERPLLSR